MIRLGIIIVFLIVFFFAFRWFYRNVVTKNLHRKHMAEIVQENNELDEVLARLHEKQSDVFSTKKKEKQ